MRGSFGWWSLAVALGVLGCADQARVDEPMSTAWVEFDAPLPEWTPPAVTQGFVVFGSCVDAKTGVPIAAATVRAVLAAGSGTVAPGRMVAKWGRPARSIEVTSRPDGSFQLEVPAGFGLEVVYGRAPGFETTQRLLAREVVKTLDLRFEPKFSLHGAVRDEAGTAIAGVPVRVYREDPARSFERRAGRGEGPAVDWWLPASVDGRFELDPQAFDEPLHFEALGAAIVEGQRFQAAGFLRAVNHDLKVRPLPAIELRGRFIEADGRPVVASDLFALIERPERGFEVLALRTDAAGDFLVRVPEALRGQPVTFREDPYPDAAGSLANEGGSRVGDGAAFLRRERLERAVLRAIDARNGAALLDWELVQVSAAEPASIEPGAPGEFALISAQPLRGIQALVAASGDGLPAQWVDVQVREDTTLALQSGVQRLIQVVDSLGRPWPGITVVLVLDPPEEALRRQRVEVGFAVTDAKGQVVLEGVAGQEHRVKLILDDGSEASGGMFSFAAGARALRVTLPARASLSIELRGAGRPDGALWVVPEGRADEVIAAGAATRWYRAVGRPDARGRIVIDAVPAGRHELIWVVEREDRLHARKLGTPISVSAGEALSLSLDVLELKLLPIAGQIRVDGRPLEGAEVFALPSADGSLARRIAVSGADGRFQAEVFQEPQLIAVAGRVLADGRTEGVAIAGSLALNVSGDGAVPLDFALETLPLTIQCLQTDPAVDVALRSFVIQRKAAPSLRFEAATDANGTLRWAAISKGTWQLKDPRGAAVLHEFEAETGAPPIRVVIPTVR